MNKLTKVLSVFIIAGAIGAGVTGAAGCAHKHSYSDDYTSAGAEGHYHVATCKHTDQHTEIEAHEYDNDQDTTCNKCDYVRTLETPGTSDVAVTEVSITGADTVEVDKSIQLTAVITPSNATNKSVSWDIVEGAEFAEISASGLLTAYSETGTVKVKATAGGKSATKTITITEAHVEETPTVSSVAISGESTVKVNATLTLTATVSGTGNFAQTVTWTVTNGTGEATISESGVLTPSKAGTVTVKATSTADSTKFAEKTITIAELTKYDALCGQSNKIYQSDFSTAADRLPDFSGAYGGEAGVYTDFAVNKDTAGATRNTHYVKVENNKAVQVNPGAGTTYTVFDFGALADGVTEVYLEATLTGEALGAKWTFLQLMGDTAEVNNTEVFGFRTGGDKNNGFTVGYRLGSGDAIAAPSGKTFKVEQDKAISIYIKYDSANKKLTVEIDNEEFCKDFDLSIKGINGLRLSSGDSNKRSVNIANVVLCGTQMSASEYAQLAKATLDAELSEYVFDGIDATHSINKDRVQAAYNKGVEGIQKQNATTSEIAAALNTAIAEMRAVLSDAEISAAQEEACEKIAAAYPADNYTKTGLTDDPDFPLYPDSKYNNKETYEASLAAAQAEIRTKTNRVDIQAAYDKHDELLGAIWTDSEVIQEKIKEAQYRIEVYLADEIAALEGGEFNATYLELVRLKKEEGTELLPQWRTVAEINQKLANLKSRIDDIYATTQMQLEDVIKANKESLTDYVTEQLVKFNASVADDKEVIDLIQGMDGNGGVQKDGLDAIDAATTRGEANAALIKARTTIAFMVTRGEAVQRIKTYSDGLKEGFYLNTALALFDTEAAKHIANAKAVAVPSTDGDTWEEGFETANQDITNVRLAAREALDGKVAEATALELAARETWSGSASTPATKTVDFVAGKPNSNKTISGTTYQFMTVNKATGSDVKWNKSGYISFYANNTATLEVPANSKLTLNYSGTTAGRYFMVTGAPNGVNVDTFAGNYDSAAGKYDASVTSKVVTLTFATAGTYTLTFSVGEHKIQSFVLEYNEIKTITDAKVNKLTAVNDGANTVVTAELELDDKSTTTVILSASEYTVIGNTVIYGTGKTADDANKYNSCEITNA